MIHVYLFFNCSIKELLSIIYLLVIEDLRWAWPTQLRPPENGRVLIFRHLEWQKAICVLCSTSGSVRSVLDEQIGKPCQLYGCSITPSNGGKRHVSKNSTSNTATVYSVLGTGLNGLKKRIPSCRPSTTVLLAVVGVRRSVRLSVSSNV